jgi:uncharacterized membrane protein
MTDTQRRDGNADGVKSFFWVLDLVIHLALWVVLVTFLAVLADIVMAYTLWRDDPVGWIQGLVRYYLAQTTAPDVGRKAADGLYWMWFGWTGIDASVRAYIAGAMPSNGLQTAFGRLLFGDGATVVVLAMYGVKLVAIRGAMLLMTIPQFALAMFVGLADGLVARYIRRAQGGHESATRYHRAKRLLAFGLIPLLSTIWLLAPIRMGITALVCPVSLVVFFAFRTLAKFYKKYV